MDHAPTLEVEERDANNRATFSLRTEIARKVFLENPIRKAE